MHNINFSGSSNNYKQKIKSQNINSITPNTKINQYINKTRKLHRSPIIALNKSQNISITKNVFKTNINNFISNNPILFNTKKLYAINNIKNIHFINKNKNFRINNVLYNKNIINRSISKNNSLSNYFTKTSNKINPGLKRNHTNSNIINKTNANISNFNEYLKNNHFYHERINAPNLKKNYKKEEKSPIINVKDYLITDDINLPKNIKLNNSLYPLIITEESKKNLNDNIKKARIKKAESVCNTYMKNKYPIQKIKGNSTTLFSKQNSIINNNQNKLKLNSIILGNQTSSSGGLIENLSTEKNSGIAHLDTFENKIINEIKELKNYKKDEINDKIKTIFEEAIEYLVPKESQNVFLLILNEFSNINKEYSDNLNHFKEINENLKQKINNYENKYKDLIIKLKSKEKELNTLKIEVEKFNNEKKKFENLKISENDNKNDDDIYRKILKKNISSIDLKVKRDYNTFIKKVNAKNVDDLDALYFFDKINYNQNDVEKEIPLLNLEQKYIEQCIENEIIKRNEINLTPFQKIALQFELLDS